MERPSATLQLGNDTEHEENHRPSCACVIWRTKPHVTSAQGLHSSRAFVVFACWTWWCLHKVSNSEMNEEGNSHVIQTTKESPYGKNLCRGIAWFLNFHLDPLCIWTCFRQHSIFPLWNIFNLIWSPKQGNALNDEHLISCWRNWPQLRLK